MLHFARSGLFSTKKMSYEYYNLLNPANFPPSDFWRDRFYNGPGGNRPPGADAMEWIGDPNALVQPIATGYPKPGSETITEEENSDDENKLNNMGGGRYSGSVKATKNVNLKKKGLKMVYENSGKVFDYNCVYVGHTSCNLDRALLVVCVGLVRCMLSKLGLNTNQHWDYAYPTDGIWQLDIKQDPITSAVSVDYDTTAIASPETLFELATALKDRIDSQYTTHRNSVITAFRVIPRIDAAGSNISTLSKQINLNTAFVDISCISILKVQNTTKHLNTSGTGQDEYATAVDAAPLCGKIYRGPGQGMYGKSEDPAPVYLIDNGGTEASRGAITACAGAFEEYQEPINAESMYYCQKSNGVKFQPGELKSSHLKFHKKTSATRIIQRLGIVYANLAWCVPDFGNFQIFGLEKMIGIKGTELTDNPAVEVDYEVNSEWYVYVTSHNENNPPQYFSKSNSVTHTA